MVLKHGHGAFFSILTCKCKVLTLVPSLSVAKTRELPHAAYALLQPAWGLHFIPIFPDFNVFEGRNGHPIWMNGYQNDINVIFNPKPAINYHIL